MNLDLSQLNLSTMGVTAGVCLTWLVLVNIAKAGWIPLEIPARWRPLVANLGAALSTVAVLHLMGAPFTVAIMNGLAPLILAPSALHANVAGPAAKPENTPSTITNASEVGKAVGDAVAAAMPAAAPTSTTNNATTIVLPESATPETAAAAVAASMAPPPNDVPTPATGGSS